MRVLVALTVALASLGGARAARTIAKADLNDNALSEPYAPSPAAAPFLSLGYREAAADSMFVRLRGYFGDPSAVPDAVASLCEAIVALDPRFYTVYDYCGNAMTFAGRTVTQSISRRAVALLERGAHEFPDDWKLPKLAGQIYTQDLQTDDPVQRRAWDERGTLLIESAIRKPGAPVALAEWAAVMRTKFGQRERATQGLRELLLTTTEPRARKALLVRLAKLENQDVDQIAGELYEARREFTTRWLAARPALPPTWFVLLGPRPTGSFDMSDLATGGHDLVTIQPAREAPLD